MGEGHRPPDLVSHSQYSQKRFFCEFLVQNTGKELFISQFDIPWPLHGDRLCSKCVYSSWDYARAGQ